MQQFSRSRGAARAPEPTVGPWLAFDLAGQIEQLRQEPYWQSGRNSKTIAHYPDFRVVVTVIQANTAIHEHKTAGRVTVQTLQGHLRMHASGKEFDLPAGHILVVDQAVPYDLHAVEDSALLLIVAWPEAEG
jgi:quercetin dioxygenase-like cupin family protein